MLTSMIGDTRNKIFSCSKVLGMLILLVTVCGLLLQSQLDAVAAKSTNDRSTDAVSTAHQATLMLQKGRPQEALKLVERATREAPDAPGVWALYAAHLMIAKRYKESEAAIQKGLSINPQSSTCWAALGCVLGNQHKCKEAVPALLKAIELGKKNSPSIYSELGHCYTHMEKNSEAEQAYKRALELDSNDAHNWQCLGLFQQMRGEEEAAIKSFEESVRIDPKEESCWYNLGWALTDRNDLRAKKCFEKAIALKRDSQNEYGLAASLFRLGNYAGAEAHCRASIKLDPKDFDGWLFLFQILLEDRKSAIRATLREMFKSQPEKVDFFELVRVLSDGGDLEDARWLLARLAPEKSDAPASQIAMRSMLLDAMGDSTEAKKCLERAIALNPSMAEPRFYYGQNRFNRGDRAEGIRMIRIACSLEPNNQRYFLALCYMLLQTGDLSEAEVLARRCLVMEPQSPICMSLLALVLVKEKKFKEAERYWQSPSVVYAADQNSMSNLGAIQSLLGNFSKAEMFYQKVVKEMPEDSGALTGLGIAQLNQGKNKAAIQTLRKAIDEDATGGRARTWKALGQALMKVHDQKGAEEAMKKSASKAVTASERYESIDAINVGRKRVAIRQKRGPERGLLIMSFVKASR